MVETKERKLEIFLSKLVKVIKERYDLDTQIKLSDLVYKFYFYQLSGSTNIFEDSSKDNFSTFVALNYLKEKYTDFLNSNQKFISLDSAYDIVKRVNSMLRKSKHSPEVAFSDTRMVDDIIFFIENSNLDSHYYSICVSQIKDDNEDQEKDNEFEYDSSISSYIDYISRENRDFLSKLSRFSIDKLTLSVKNILMPRIKESNMDREQAAKFLNDCISELRKEAEATSIETIEEMFRLRSSNTKYIWLWAKIRMRWVNKLKRLSKNIRTKRNSKRKTKK